MIELFKKIGFCMVLMCCTVTAAQTLGSKLDKRRLGIGEVATFRISISGLNGKKVGIAPKNELLPFHFEEVSDSTTVQPNYYERSIEFAIFEEGKFSIPPLEVKIGEELFQTVPYEVIVKNSTTDDQINDIMNNKSVELSWGDYWDLYKWYLLGAFAFISLVIAVVTFLRYHGKRKTTPEYRSSQTLKELEALRKKAYIESLNYRSFYVELLDITRNFIVKQYHIPADVLLTDDLIALMKKTNSISKSNEKIVEDVLLRGDLVKFAKTIPDQAIMQKDFDDIFNFVKRSYREIEAEQLRSGV